MRIDKNPIIIVGMQRSGTSALAGALEKLGVFFGKEELLYKGDANNPHGYFEHRKATILNLRCLHAFHMHPTSFNRMPTHWQEHPEAESLRNELREYLKADFSNRGPWGIKQPVTSLVLPLYNDVFSELGIRPHYILCVRNPLENMASEAKLDFGQSYRVMPSLGSRAIGSWLRYTLGAVADVEGQMLSVVYYGDLLTKPTETLKRLVSRHADWHLADFDVEEAAKTIRTDLRHNSFHLDALNPFPAIVKKTLLAAIAFEDSNPDCWNSLLAHHQEFQTWVNLMGDPEPMAGKLGLAWFDDGKIKVSETLYQPTGQWQTIRLQVNAPQKTPVSGLLYAQPFRAWIRRSIWHFPGSKTPAIIRSGIGSSLTSEGGVYKLNGVFEPNQISFVTPGSAGPYELELEFLLETGNEVSNAAAGYLAKQLDACVSSVEESQQRRL